MDGLVYWSGIFTYHESAEGMVWYVKNDILTSLDVVIFVFFFWQEAERYLSNHGYQDLVGNTGECSNVGTCTFNC